MKERQSKVNPPQDPSAGAHAAAHSVSPSSAGEELHTSGERPGPNRSDLRVGLRIELLSILWMIVEGGAALSAGIVAHSLALTAFGADSVVELVAAFALVWRLRVALYPTNAERDRRAERVASWVVGVSLIAIGFYIVAGSLFELITRAGAEQSAAGIVIAAASSVIMPIIAAGKKRIGRRIGSRALEADGSCSMVCAYMSWIVLAGVVATALFGLWWIDAVAALGLVYFVVHEGWESIEEVRRG